MAASGIPWFQTGGNVSCLEPNRAEGEVCLGPKG